MPILEPEVDIKAPDKAEAEALVTDGILSRLATLPQGARVMLKLTIPSRANLRRHRAPRGASRWPCRAATRATSRTSCWPRITA